MATRNSSRDKAAIGIDCKQSMVSRLVQPIFFCGIAGHGFETVSSNGRETKSVARRPDSTLHLFHVTGQRCPDSCNIGGSKDRACISWRQWPTDLHPRFVGFGSLWRLAMQACCYFSIRDLWAVSRFILAGGLFGCLFCIGGLYDCIKSSGNGSGEIAEADSACDIPSCCAGTDATCSKMVWKWSFLGSTAIQ